MAARDGDELRDRRDACTAAFALIRIATAQGLEGGFGSADVLSDSTSFESAAAERTHWRRDPLLRKEWLWLKRDRGALLQLLGMPLALVALQFSNVRNLLHGAQTSWHKLAGVIVGLAGYLLFTAGPRALLSEGPALALTLTWPRSLEDTLRMKVRLLFTLVTAMVWASLAAVAWMLPHDAWKLLAVAAAWPLFGLSVAEKSVTLIRAPSQSGEPEPLPQGQLWAANLGNLAFAIALFTARWQLAFAAIVMNWVFAGALWQSFRVRLAYLFDPDSEPVLRPPTILSSVIAIVGMLELAAVIGALFAIGAGPGGISFAQAMGYGIAAVVVSIAVVAWNGNRGVRLRDTVVMEGNGGFAPAVGCIAALAIGGALALAALGYLHLARMLPFDSARETFEHSRDFFARNPNARMAYALMAIGIAPWVEEFLFRGLMFRAMLPQWGLARATLTSAGFFTILHPFLSWPPVFGLGVCNALVFARTRALLPCVLLHATYNAIVVTYAM